jgi:hypothetical protein
MRQFSPAQWESNPHFLRARFVRDLNPWSSPWQGDRDGQTPLTNRIASRDNSCSCWGFCRTCSCDSSKIADSNRSSTHPDCLSSRLCNRHYLSGVHLLSTVLEQEARLELATPCLEGRRSTEWAILAYNWRSSFFRILPIVLLLRYQSIP